MIRKMEIPEYKGFDGHIVLYCKNHYNISDIKEDLKKIWAVRCGYEYKKDDNSMIRNILNTLYKILSKTNKDNIMFQELLHDHLLNWIYKDLSIEQNLLLYYVGRIANIQVKDKLPNGKWKILIKLPKPKKQLFNRILRGNGRYEDYKLLQ